MSNVAPPHEGPDPVRAGGPSGFATDDIDHTLLRARALIDAALLQHQRMSSERLVDELPDDDTVASAGHGLIDEAQQEVLCALPTGGNPGDRLDPTLRALKRAAGRGVRVKVLCNPSALLSPFDLLVLEEADTWAGIQVAEFAVAELLILDQKLALVRADASIDRGQALLIRAPAVRHLLERLFTASWRSGRPLKESVRLGQRARCETTRKILTYLSAGYKDDVAARKLGLSVRTYRRHVADIMRDLGAESRFQAGVRAAELGLLSNG